ncbi:hypothetical protein CTAYLR_004350 [Chrysophaeum taylorii]|uniref:Glycosyltransferase family 61 protein n=1 Tax=Chrysophaeum taylorii TaxID=2483200 RepID=A0AAD7XTF9_9STRA|nr:hypothetical protein CTAYLR_004350 [Chrysophaeum taylorii]
MMLVVVVLGISYGVGARGEVSLSWLARYAPFPAQSEAEAQACGAACAAELEREFGCELLAGGRLPTVPACNVSDSNARWERVRSGARVVVCSGPHGSIECLRNGAAFCVAHGLWAPRARPEACAARTGDAATLDKATATACAWTVYCRRHREADDIAARALGLASSGASPQAGRRGAATPGWPRLQVVDKEPPAERVDIDETYYFARRGDCGGSSPNPAHCVADVSNFYATRRVAREVFGVSDSTRVVLGSGFHYGAGGPWGRNSTLERTTLWLAWLAGARDGVYVASRPELWARRDAWWFETLGTEKHYRLRYAVTSPPPMTAITWGPHACKAQVRSTVLADLRRTVDAFVDPLVTRQLSSSVGEAAEQSAFVLFIARAPLRVENATRRLDRKKKTTIKHPPGTRAIHNMHLIVQAARVGRVHILRAREQTSTTDRRRARWPGIEMRVHVADDRTPYALQMALWRRARLVVGMHGGALSGAIWLSPGQALLEITPREHSCGFPSMFAHIAVAVGARYRGVLCRDCTMGRGGSVDVDGVLRAMAALLPA